MSHSSRLSVPEFSILKKTEILQDPSGRRFLREKEICAMKVLLINSSPKPNGNTAHALEEMKKVFEEQGVEAPIIHIGNKDIRGCIACGYCKTHGECVFHDMVNETAPLFKEADGLVIGSPVYYANTNSTAHAFMTRLFYSTPFDKSMKCGASVVCARRGGASTAFDDLNKYFSISNMPIVTSSYWNMVYGRLPGEAAQDVEGMATVRNLARNMVFLMKSIDLGKKELGMPEKEPQVPFNFIR